MSLTPVEFCGSAAGQRSTTEYTSALTSYWAGVVAPSLMKCVKKEGVVTHAAGYLLLT